MLFDIGEIGALSSNDSVGRCGSWVKYTVMKKRIPCGFAGALIACALGLGNSLLAADGLVGPIYPVPKFGSFYSLTHTNWPPAPCPPTLFTNVVYAIVGWTNHYVYNDLDDPDHTGGEAPLSRTSEKSNESCGDSQSGPLAYDYPSNSLFLEITGMTTNGDAAFLTLHGVQSGEVYELMSSPVVPAAKWNAEQALFTVSNQNSISTTVPVMDRTNALFFWARDWTGIDENLNSTPDWWDWVNYGPPVAPGQTLHTTTNTPLNIVLQAYDPQGNPISYIFLSEPTNGVRTGTAPYLTYTPAADYDGPDSFTFKVTDGAFDSKPATISISVDTTIQFSIAAVAEYTTNTSVPVQLNVTAGVPRMIAVLLDSTNFAAASWLPYSSPNISINASTEGWHGAWIGLRGNTDVSPRAWQWTKFKVDKTSPQLTVTKPPSTTVSQPLIQLKGTCPEPLSAISYDLTNAAGVLTNQQVVLLDHGFDTNIWDITTTTFQAFDVPLTNGINAITLHATDLAGNSTNQLLTVTIDYASKTNPPIVRLYWPQDGAGLPGSNTFTCRGWIDDFTATVKATVVDAASNVTSFDGLVERDGNFWIQNMPLAGGTNAIQIIVQDVVSNVAVTNFTVVASSLGLTVDGYDGAAYTPILSQTAVWGRIDSSDYTVWVNGVQAQVDDSGNWLATNVPVHSGSSYVFQARAIPNTDNGGHGSVSGGFLPDYSSSGNPTSAQAVDAEIQEDKPSTVYLTSYNYDYHGSPAMPARQSSETYGPDGSLTGSTEYDFWTDINLRYTDSSSNHESRATSTHYVYNGNESDTHCDLEVSFDWDPTIFYGANAHQVTASCTGGTNTYTDDGGPQVFSNVCDQKTAADSESDSYSDGHHTHSKSHSEFQRRMQSRFSLYTGGKSVPGATKLFQLLFLVYEDLRKDGTADQINDPLQDFMIFRPLRPLSQGEFSTGGLGNPDDLGYVYANFPANQTVDIGPKANLDYYEGGPGASEVKLRIYDANTGAELTDKTTTVVVGQQINLYSQVLTPTNAPVTAYSWNVPGYAISNFVATPTSGTVYSNFPTTVSNVVFYWVDGATDRAVACSAIVRGKKAVGQAIFKVVRPSADWTAEADAVMSVDDNFQFPALHFGFFASPTNKGMLFHFKDPDPKGYQGLWFFEWAQLVQSYARGNFSLTNNVGLEERRTGLDIRFPAQAWSSAPGDDLDSPGVGTAAVSKILLQASFTNYLMFKPILVAPSIPVPIKKIEWSVSGTATNNAGTWSLLSSPNDFSIPQNNVDTLVFPTWTANATNGARVLTNWF
jgi:hypothetical protein